MGIIGKNGSGKSTLLKLITGIYRPTSGTIAVNGRVAALIELGAGFHPDFTGRENLVLGGVLHGMSRAEIDDRFDEIVEFAELEDFIDDPVRTYSSGMFMRLGFSLAIHTDPDLLLIDEVLAVGDASFVNKCKEKVSELRREGKTLLLVSHDLAAIERWCDEAIWLHEGRVEDRGDPRRVIDAYRHFIENEEEEELLKRDEEAHAAAAGESPHTEEDFAEPSENAFEPARWGSREIEIVRIGLVSDENDDRRVFSPDDSLVVEIDYVVRNPELVTLPVFGVGLHRSDGLVVYGSNTNIEKIQVPDLGDSGSVRYTIERIGLLEGNYSIDVAVHKEDGYAYDYHRAPIQFAIRNRFSQVGVVSPEHTWEFRSAAEVISAAGNES